MYQLHHRIRYKGRDDEYVSKTSSGFKSTGCNTYTSTHSNGGFLFTFLWLISQNPVSFYMCTGNKLSVLSQRGYFKEAYFVNYLKYLLYWKRPEYARALKYPQCLHFLEAVQSEEFREAIACSANAKYIEEQQLLQWQYYTRKRMRLHMHPGGADEKSEAVVPPSS